MTKILVVEDEALIAADIQQTLIGLGFEVPATVDTGAAALESVDELRPSLVLMDIKLRGKMDGIAAAAEIRSRFGTPVVFLTSHSDEATLSRAVATEPYGYLLKPFADRELRTAIIVALQKHELESRLATRERWFSTTLRSIGDAVIATDAKHVISFMNAQAEKLTGWGAEAVGRPLSEVFRIVDQAGVPIAGPVKAPLAESFAVSVQHDSGLLPKQGDQIPIDESSAPIIDDRGVVLGGVVVFRDITARRKLEERLSLTERLASLGTMAAGMAHEINNPLASVVANVELSTEAAQSMMTELGSLNGGPAEPPMVARLLGRLAEQREGLQDAAEGAERVRLIVRDLRRFIGAAETSRTLVDLPDVLEGAIKLTDNTVRHHARVERRLGTTPFVEANEGQLGQVFVNLLVNAAHAVGDGDAAHQEITITTYTDPAGHAVVEVQDTGPGIRPEVLPKIFEPFFTTKPVGSGMGLGLAISHGIVQSIGGQLVAESPAGKGALFRVVLPPARSEATPRSKQKSASPPGRRGQVLVIDDERAVALSMERALRGEHEVTMLTDGREALSRIANGQRFDAIICDVMMPNMSGIDVYEALAVANPGQAERMIFVTGGAFTVETTEFLENTTNVHISKPFGIDTLRSIVRDYVK
jgi:two-component system cell cycle sensor histidine kinase/response regulator CckA